MMMTGQALPIFFNAWMSDYWAFGVLGCKLYAVHGAVIGTVSIWTMVIIGYDRCAFQFGVHSVNLQLVVLSVI